MILKKGFFDRSPVLVARDLIGKILVREVEGKISRSKIVETESYGDARDLASHARHGETLRNAAMFSHPATIYVYFTYGMHYMVNITCREKGIPSAVLIRAVEDLEAGEKIIGPGRVTKKLSIDKSLNHQKLSKSAGLWIEESKKKEKLKIEKTPRIGIAYAGPVWAGKLYRFVLQSPSSRVKNRMEKKAGH